MKIETYKINPKLNLKIAGDESWLKPMISEFDANGAQSHLAVDGEVDFTSDSAGFVYCKGKLNFNATNECTNCQKSSPWKHDIKVDVTWRPPFESYVPKDTQLTASDLDTYFIENEAVDFGQFIYDTILCDLPLNYENSVCEACEKASPNTANIQQKGRFEEEKQSPFSKLADLIAKKS